jgi:hypothetical protein
MSPINRIRIVAFAFISARSQTEPVDFLANSCLAANVLRPRHCLTFAFNRFQEHLLPAHPQAVVAVFLPVDYEFFLRFAMSG